MKRAVVCSLIVLLVISAGGFVLSRDRGGDDQRGPVRQAADRRAARATTVPAAGRPGGGSRVGGQRQMPPEYHVLLDRSMFALKPRQPPVENRVRPAPPEASYVLRGVTVQSGDVTALVEDVAAGRVHRVHAGDPLGRGRVRRVGLDGFEYEADGRATRVSIGHDLSGTQFSTTSAVAAKGDYKADGRDGHDAGRRKRRGDYERDATAASPVSP